MTIFRPEHYPTPPRADMFLPDWLLGFGIFLDAGAVFCLIVTFITQLWLLLIGFLLFGTLGIAAWLCWKNQTVKIIDDDTFVYTTFLGNQRPYRFDDIKTLYRNQDSWTLLVGDGKIHIEAIACISQTFIDKINFTLDRKNNVHLEFTQDT